MAGRRSVRFCVAVMMVGLLGCVDGGIAGSGGTGGMSGGGGSGDRGAGGIGGSAGAGGAGGVALCAPESIDAGPVKSVDDTGMAIDGEGNVFVIWRDGHSEASVWVNRWTAASGWSLAERLSTPEAATSSPDIAVDGDGNAFAVWSESDCLGTEDIVSRRFERGEGWGAAEHVESEVGFARVPRVEVDSLGNAIVVWAHIGESGIRTVWSNRWTPGGGWGSSQEIGSSGSDQWHIPEPALAVSADGGAVVLWRQPLNWNDYRLWANSWTEDDGWGPSIELEGDESVGDLDVAFGPNGEAMALWSTSSGLYSSRWDGTWEPVPTVVTGGRTYTPTIEFDSVGNAMAAWNASSQVRTARWSPTEGWSDWTPHFNFPRECAGHRCTSAGSPDLATNADGTVFLMWRESRLRRSDIGWAEWTETGGWSMPYLVETSEWVASPITEFDAVGNLVGIWGGRILESMRFDDQCIADTTPYDALGAGGAGGTGGAHGVAEDLCEGVMCPDTECRSGGSCDPEDGTCMYQEVNEDGFACSEGVCVSGGCGRVGARACTEEGLRTAVEEGAGPHYFACDEAVPVVLSDTLVIDSDVILDGEGELIFPSGSPAIIVEEPATVELRGVRFTGDEFDGSLFNNGDLTVVDSRIVHFGNYDEGELALVDCEVVAPESYNSGVATLTRTHLIATTLYPFLGDERPTGVGLYNGGTLTMTDSMMTGPGYSEERPRPLPLTHSPITNAYGGRLVIERSTIADHYHYWVGAIDNSGTLDLIDSTLANNTVERGPTIRNSGTMNVVGSTISGGRTVYGCGGYGHGYAVWNSGSLIVENSTIADNAIGSIQNYSEMSIGQSILDGLCANARYITPSDDPVTSSGGHNVVSGPNECGVDDPSDLTDVTTEELALGALGDNGGPTPTHLPGAGSVAIDAIPEASCVVTNDQRGEPRPAGNGCDAGSVEVQ